MHRLLQGEVGSGKTVVAVAALLRAVEGGYQGAVMAPTEVLATQHYLGIAGLLEGAGLEPTQEGEGAALGMDSLFAGDGPAVSVALLTSSACEVNFLPSGSTPASTWFGCRRRIHSTRRARWVISRLKPNGSPLLPASCRFIPVRLRCWR